MSTELATGHISLTVKYGGNAMKQIASDLMGLDKVAARVGDEAGETLASRLLRSSKLDASDVNRSLSGFEKGAKSAGDDAGGFHDSVH